MRKENVLVELFVCSDPLCGEETFQLIEVEDKSGFSYIERQPMGVESELLVSSEKLTAEQVIKLLDETNWFNSDIPLELADISVVEDVPSLMEGDFPLFTISGSILGAELKFREWVERWIKKNRHSLE
jgi:hypothetical protein